LRSRTSSATTLKSIAKKANVSVATVSRVINNSDHVGPNARRSVEKVMKDLNYDRKRAVRRNGVHGRRIGLLVADITDPFYPPLLKGVSHAAMSNNADLVFCDLARDPKIETYWAESLRASRIDGIIQAPAGERLNPLTVKMIAEGFPLVLLLDHAIEDQNICVVTTDREVGVYHATKYLLDLGHRDILFVAGPPHLNTSVARGRGYRSALSDAGITPAPEKMVFCDGSYEGAYSLLLEVKEKLQFSAVIAQTDMMAAGIWKALTDKGVRVPDDVSLIGYDDTMISRVLSLTTVAQPTYEIGKNALALVLDIINGRREPPQRVVLRDSLIIRNSCKKL